MAKRKVRKPTHKKTRVRVVVIPEDVRPQGAPDDALGYRFIDWIDRRVLEQVSYGTGRLAARAADAVWEKFAEAQPGDEVELLVSEWKPLNDWIEKQQWTGGARHMLTFLDAIGDAEERIDQPEPAAEADAA